MKTLYVCRLYSGFEESLKSGVWRPTGAPTIARMIEHLDRREDISLSVILTQKGFDDTLLPPRVKMDGLATEFQILRGPSSFPKWMWKFRDKFSEVYQCLKVMQTCRRDRPDIVYLDRGNIFTAAMLARFTDARVIWRVMGVLGIMHRAAKENSLRARLLRWLWRSPFNAVICTRDGSDGEPWLKAMLDKDVPYYMLVNGIEFNLPAEPVALPEGTKALFVGRLEPMKGAEAFLEALANVPDLQGIVVGDGSLRPQLEAMAAALGIKTRVHFLGACSPAQLKYIRQNCDFYVSLNTHGNITNVNLEALSDHLPTIIPSSDPEKGIDSDTDALIPADVFYRFGKVGDRDALVKTFEFMMLEENRAAYRAAAQECAGKILRSWDERVEDEVKIYEKIRSDDFAIVIADLGPGGAQKVAVSLCRELIEAGKKVSVITLQNAEKDFHALPDSAGRITLEDCNKYKGLKANLVRIYALRKALKKTGARQVVSFIAPTNILCVFACLGLPARLIISERNDPAAQSFGRMWDGLRKLTYRFADVVTANSENAVESLKAYVPVHKLRYVPNALARPETIMRDKEKIVLIVGRLYPQKSHATLLDAFAKTRDIHPDWKLVIAGDGTLKNELIEEAKNLGIQDAVEFKGLVRNPAALYEKAAIFTLPSLFEGTPNALLEAMSYACAPVVSDGCKSARSYIEDGRSGLFFPAGDADALAEKLLTLMADKAKTILMGEQSLKAVAPFQKTSIELWADILEERG